jgi:hypothetical protein
MASLAREYEVGEATVWSVHTDAHPGDGPASAIHSHKIRRRSNRGGKTSNAPDRQNRRR